MSITHDKEFKLALASLPVDRQHQIAGSVCRRTQDLSHDVRVKLSKSQLAGAKSPKPWSNTGFLKPSCSVEET